MSPIHHPSTSTYFDLQVNGYGGVDFNCDDLSADNLHKVCATLKDHGVGGILATIITGPIDVICRRVARLVKLREADSLAKEIIAGVHIEGPFISPDPLYHGAHPHNAIHPANVDETAKMIDAGSGLVRLLTLDPQYDDGMKTVRYLSKQGIVIAAGHTNASLDTLKEAHAAGMTMFTHLGNGCPITLNRHDNIIQRVLSLSDLFWCCFIADGAHIPWFALKNYLKVVGVEKAIVTTDAMTAAGVGPGTYTLNGLSVTIGEDLIAWAPTGNGALYGSVTTMRVSDQNLQKHLQLSQRDCHKLLCDNPRVALGLS
jgi:N-acetylglucosamine-6-phosphate deacetylase